MADSTKASPKPKAPKAAASPAAAAAEPAAKTAKASKAAPSTTASSPDAKAKPTTPSKTAGATDASTKAKSAKATCTEAPSSSTATPATPSPTVLININAASVEELQKVPGVGDKRAAAIVAYREQHTPAPAPAPATPPPASSEQAAPEAKSKPRKSTVKVFKTVDDLVLVSGISTSTVEAMRPYVTVKGGSKALVPVKHSDSAPALGAASAAAPTSASSSAASSGSSAPKKSSAAASAAPGAGAASSMTTVGAASSSSSSSSPGTPSKAAAKSSKPSSSSSLTTSGSTTTATATAATSSSSSASGAAAPAAKPKATKPTKPKGKAPTTIKIASWNVKNLSTNTDLRRFSRVAMAIACYHLVALQEVKSVEVIEKLIADPSNELQGWQYVISEAPVGVGTHLEYYAFLWRGDIGCELIASGLFADPHQLFARRPFVATFKVGKFDFTLITVHVIYGADAKPRVKEVKLLAQVVKTTLENNGGERDVMLLGDFNTPPNSDAWKDLQLLNYTNLIFGAGVSSTIALNDAGNLYDNIWYCPASTGRNFVGTAGVADIYAMFSISNTDAEQLRELRAQVSDHKPIFAEFRTDVDEDAGCEYGKHDKLVVSASAIK